AIQVRDRVLGEKLGIVDPQDFSDLESLRAEVVSLIDDHLAETRSVPRVMFGQPFYFMQSRVLEIPTGVKVRTLTEFRDAIAPAGTVDFLRRLSERVRNRRLLNLSASREVGGVAEILRGLVPLLEEVGVESAWESVDPEGAAAGIGTPLHHALQGGEERLPDDL